jgi:DNA-binding MarR family transcriptional regulator
MSSRFSEAARFFQVLSSPIRLCMLHTLSSEERRVVDLAGVCGIDDSTASRCVASLREEGWIKGRKSGREVFYGLTPEVACRLQMARECIDSVVAAGLAVCLDDEAARTTKRKARKTTFGKIIQSKLEETGQNRRWLARCVGVSKTTVALWVRGQLMPNETHLRKLRHLLGISFGEDKQGEPKAEPKAEQDFDFAVGAI